ncbi:hypothetical protein TWF730_008490 [Orbilia blumenaviensis]|uniref:Ribose-5-phosphate isomerase n=1 Tax=Orbilia blumenaviensis TaxID=1796055 RepID=A0AAV9V5Q0_9PEZI
MSLITAIKTTRPPAIQNVVSSLIILYILRNFCTHMSETHRARISEGILERMERLLTKVRTASLKSKNSGLRRKKSKEKQAASDPGDSKDAITTQPIENEHDELQPTKRVSRDFSISTTPPAIYGSTFSLAEGPELIAVEPLPKVSSRRSSMSKPGRKPSLQHVGFQSPELEPEEDYPAPVPAPGPAPSPARTDSTKTPKDHKGHRLPSIASLISNITSSRSNRPARVSRSTTTVRKLAAYKAVSDNFPTNRPAYIAIGSGSLMLQVVEKLSQYSYSQLADITFVSTGVASEHIMASYKLRPITSLSLLSPETKIDVYFDTADKVDDNLNCIRGRTGNLHLERMVALRSECFVCIIDYNKRVPTLFTMGKSMAVEITPESYFYAIKKLRAVGAIATLRHGEPVISGPCITQRGTYIIDASWPALGNADSEVEVLAEILKGLYGVVDHGLFYAGKGGWNGRPHKVYVGLSDGAVNSLG